MKRTTLVIVALATFSVLFVGIYIYASFAVSAYLKTSNVTIQGPVSATAALAHKGALSFNFSTNMADYAVASYQSINATTVNGSIGMYVKDPAQRVYVVDVGDYCLQFQCFSVPSFYNQLGGSLKSYGRIFNNTSLELVNINNVSSIPPGSLVIIPSGLMPNILLPESPTNGCKTYAANFTIINLLNRGDSVIYVGRNFSTSVTCNQQAINNSQATFSVLGDFGLNSTGITQSQGEALTQNTPLTFKNPTFAFINNAIEYYGVYAVNVTNGTFIAFSNNLTSGWHSNTQSLAGDIAKVIDSNFWEGRIAYGVNLNNTSPDGFLPLITVPENLRVQGQSIANISSVINNSYSLATLTFNNKQSTYEINIPFRVRYRSNGFVYMNYYLGESQTGQLVAKVDNLSSSQIGVIDIYDSNLSRVVQTIDLGPMTNNDEVVKRPTFIMPPGYYIAELSSGGNVYNGAVFYLAGFNITPVTLDFQNGNFYFHVVTNNISVSGLSYKASLNNLYAQNGSIGPGGIINYTIPRGTQIGYGNLAFDFYIGGVNYTVPYAYSNTGGSIPTFYILFGIAVVVVIVINKLLVAPASDDYYIDIPTFPPSKRPRVKENSDAILNVFDLVNYYYHWKYMPLTVSEVKTGISTNIKYGSTSIAVTSQNTLAILNKLVDRGLVETAEDYYAPKKWIDTSKHDIEYLAIFRKLRDFCVANASLFTDLDAAQGVDMAITTKNVQNYVVIYSGASGMKEITLTNRSRLFIVFLNEERKQEFLDKLYSSYTEEAEVLKMAISYSTVKLVDTYHLSLMNL